MSDMDYQQLLEQLTPEIYQRFVRAIEIGKWPDGSKLTAEQKQHCMAAVIAYQHQNVDETERVGYIDKGHKEGSQCDDDPRKGDSEQPLKWS